MTQLESALEDENSYQRKIIEFDSIETNERISNLNVYEIERIVAKRTMHTERDIHRKSHDE